MPTTQDRPISGPSPSEKHLLIFLIVRYVIVLSTIVFILTHLRTVILAFNLFPTLEFPSILFFFLISQFSVLSLAPSTSYHLDVANRILMVELNAFLCPLDFFKNGSRF